MTCTMWEWFLVRRRFDFLAMPNVVTCGFHVFVNAVLLMSYHITQSKSVFSILSLRRKCCRSTMLFLRDESQLSDTSLHMCHLKFSYQLRMYQVCSRAFFCLFENVSGMRLGRRFPSMVEKVNLAALWSWPRVLTCAHNSVSAVREIHSWPGNEKVIKWVHT